MTTPVLPTNAIFDPSLMTGLPVTQDAGVCFRHPEAGQLQVKNVAFPHMHVMNMHWQTGSDFTMYDPTPAASININFVLEGDIHSRFSGLPQELPMHSRTHNLIHTPESGHLNHIKGNQTLSMLLIELKTDFFIASLDPNDAWSEAILTNLEYERPFAGTCRTQTITPQMLCLIDDIRNCRAEGPMRNLLIQSRILELVALQIDQFRRPINVSEAIPVHEVEKLYQLKTYLETNFLADHTLAHLSRYCALNEFKVKKGFRQLFDTTVFNYLRKLRMDYAGQLLRHHALCVDEVADRLGYEHSQHFSIAFKKFTGLTPSQYQHGKSSASTLVS